MYPLNLCMIQKGTAEKLKRKRCFKRRLLHYRIRCLSVVFRFRQIVRDREKSHLYCRSGEQSVKTQPRLRRRYFLGRQYGKRSGNALSDAHLRQHRITKQSEYVPRSKAEYGLYDGNHAAVRFCQIRIRMVAFQRRRLL